MEHFPPEFDLPELLAVNVAEELPDVVRDDELVVTLLWGTVNVTEELPAALLDVELLRGTVDVAEEFRYTVRND